MSLVTSARWLTPRQRGGDGVVASICDLRATVAAMATVDLVYDPYDYTIDADPHPVWKRLRDEAPVYYNEQHDFYALSRYDDVLNALVDAHTYKSGHGIVLEMITPEPYENIEMMIMKDPPEH